MNQCTYTHTRTHVMREYTHTRTRLHTHTREWAFTHAHGHAYIHVLMHSCTNACMCTVYMHAKKQKTHIHLHKFCQAHSRTPCGSPLRSLTPVNSVGIDHESRTPLTMGNKYTITTFYLFSQRTDSPKHFGS